MSLKLLNWSSTNTYLSWFRSTMPSTFTFFPPFVGTFQSYSYCKLKPFINSFQSYLFRYKCWLSYFSNRNAKIALMRGSMVVTYYIKLFRTGTDRHNDILMSLLFLVAEPKRFYDNFSSSNAPSRLHGLREIVLLWRQEIVKLKTSSRHVLITSSRSLGERRMFTRNCLSTIYVMLFLL